MHITASEQKRQYFIAGQRRLVMCQHWPERVIASRVGWIVGYVAALFGMRWWLCVMKRMRFGGSGHDFQGII
jgi:hypothetical protein